MKLTATQIAALREQGIVRNEACDGCGKLLSELRYTRRGERGEWCSRLCRDGDAGAPSGPRRGRPKKHSDNAAKQRQYRLRLGALRNRVSAY